MRALFEDSTYPVEILKADTTITFGDTSLSVSVPKTAVYEKKQDNNASLCVTLTYGTHTMLFAGDAEEERQTELIAELSEKGITALSMLKVPHHGVWNKNLDVFFSACAPALAVITCSDKNPPEQKTLDALNAVGAQVLLSANGDISLIFTKDHVTVTQ